MKRLLSIILLIVIVFVASHASASSYNVYDLDELHIQVILPDDMIVYTRDIDEDDPYLDLLGTDRDSLISFYEASNIYLEAFDQEVSANIVVTMVETIGIKDFNLLSETTLRTMANFYETYFEENGFEVISTELYKHPQTNFVKLYTAQPYEGGTDYMIQCTTIFSGNTINITLHSLDGKVDATDEDLINSIIDDIRFDVEFVKEPERINSTDSFIYEDKYSPVSFRVPTNWKQIPLSAEREHVKAKFESQEELGLSITFISDDLWSALSEEELSVFNIFGLTRKDMNNDFFSSYVGEDFYTSFFVEFGVDKSGIEIVEYGNQTYYKATYTQEASYLGFTAPLTMTSCCTIVNGYMYHFMFAGTEDSPYYGDFESLLESVQFN